jgi:transcriptional regulator with XRE-family HTH domain
MLRKGLKLAVPTLRDLAREVGVSYGSMRSYVTGARTPSPKVLQRIVKALRARGADLARFADELEAASRKTKPRS